MTSKDYYAILEISRNASAKEIKQAYRRLAQRYHPDIHPGDKFDEEMFKAVNEAYEVLSNPEKRREYDRLQDELSRRKEYYSSPQTDVPVRQESKKRTNKRLDRFFGWMGQIRFGWFLLAALLLLIILPPAFICAPIFFPPEWGVDCLEVYDTTFQKEVLESQTPVLVVFCWDYEQWHRTQAYHMGLYHPPPIIIAVRRIIKGREFEGKIKFCKYYRHPPNDPLDAQYDIRYWPTTMIFRDGSIFWRTDYWSSVDRIKEDIEVNLRKAIGEM
jgi:hypothetical protein